MSSDMKVRVAPRYTSEEKDIILKASVLGGESPASFVRRWSLFGARCDIKKLSDLNDSKVKGY